VFGDNALCDLLLFIVLKHSWWDSVGGGSCQRNTSTHVGGSNTFNLMMNIYPGTGSRSFRVRTALMRPGSPGCVVKHGAVFRLHE
jgi:hypothetical protein